MHKAILLLALAQIADNSFLIEEAYNQEAGVVQHIFTFARPASGSEFVSTFTQEWPVKSIRHQLSYTIPVQRAFDSKGVGDVMVNYRYQWIGDGESRLAVSPRVSFIAPTGSERKGLGSGAAGLQLMLPVSTFVTPRIVAHSNVGATFIPSRDVRQYILGQSFIWLATERVNPLVEVLWTSDPSLVINPGVRWSHDLAHHTQLVPGIAFPITLRPRFDRGVFIYLSIEHPFSGK